MTQRRVSLYDVQKVHFPNDPDVFRILTIIVQKRGFS